MLSELIDKMPEGRFIQILEDHGVIRYKPGTSDELAALSQDPERFHCIGVMEQVGFPLFQSRLEKAYFNPNDYQVNYQYEYRVIKWQGILFCVISIPARKEQFCYEAAQWANIRLKKGIPFLNGQYFPLSSDERAVVVTNVRGDCYDPDRIENRFEIKRL